MSDGVVNGNIPVESNRNKRAGFRESITAMIGTVRYYTQIFSLHVLSAFCFIFRLKLGKEFFGMLIEEKKRERLEQSKKTGVRLDARLSPAQGVSSSTTAEEKVEEKVEKKEVAEDNRRSVVNEPVNIRAPEVNGKPGVAEPVSQPNVTRKTEAGGTGAVSHAEQDVPLVEVPKKPEGSRGGGAVPAAKMTGAKLDVTGAGKTSKEKKPGPKSPKKRNEVPRSNTTPVPNESPAGSSGSNTTPVPNESPAGSSGSNTGQPARCQENISEFLTHFINERGNNGDSGGASDDNSDYEEEEPLSYDDSFDEEPGDDEWWGDDVGCGRSGLRWEGGKSRREIVMDDLLNKVFGKFISKTPVAARVVELDDEGVEIETEVDGEREEKLAKQGELKRVMSCLVDNMAELAVYQSDNAPALEKEMSCGIWDINSILYVFAHDEHGAEAGYLPCNFVLTMCEAVLSNETFLKKLLLCDSASSIKETLKMFTGEIIRKLNGDIVALVAGAGLTDMGVADDIKAFDSENFLTLKNVDTMTDALVKLLTECRRNRGAGTGSRFGTWDIYQRIRSTEGMSYDFLRQSLLLPRLLIKIDEIRGVKRGPLAEYFDIEEEGEITRDTHSAAAEVVTEASDNGGGEDVGVPASEEDSSPLGKLKNRVCQGREQKVFVVRDCDNSDVVYFIHRSTLASAFAGTSFDAQAASLSGCVSGGFPNLVVSVPTFNLSYPGVCLDNKLWDEYFSTVIMPLKTLWGIIFGAIAKYGADGCCDVEYIQNSDSCKMSPENRKKIGLVSEQESVKDACEKIDRKLLDAVKSAVSKEEALTFDCSERHQDNELKR